ncbi:site-specific DNA-methyltransferase [Lachnospiraceae bacterium 45-P1]
MDKLKMETPDLTQANIEKLAALFPACVTEARGEDGKLKKAVNFELLRQMLSDAVLEGDEAYEFTWVGKKAAIVEANRPIRKTLRPCPAESVDWDTTENLYIEGDNLEVLKLLQESYLGKVKMIYIDPPYNTGNDFIYRDDFEMSEEEFSEGIGQIDEETGDRLFRNTDSNGRFHSDWCSMIYSRLMLARNLLADDGVIFVSINDSEIDSLRKICTEIFGAANNVATLIWQQRKGGGNDSRYIAVDHEYVLVYSKNIALLGERWRIAHSNEYITRYKEIDTDGRRYYWDTLVRNGLQNPIIITVTTPDGNDITINSQWSKNRVLEGLTNGTVKFTKTNAGWSLHHKVYMKKGQVLRSLLTEYGNNRSAGQELVGLFGTIYFDYAKPTKLIEILQTLCTTSDDIIMDFFSGSATTAHAVMQLNAQDGGHRKFIMVQLPEPCDEQSEAYKAGFPNICEIGKERIRRAAKKIAADNPGKPFDGGFRVFKLADTNMTDVYYSAGEYDQSMLDQLVSNIKPDRTDMDLLFGCLLEWGLPLSMPYTSEKNEGCTVHTYNDGDLIACFDEDIPETVIKEIAKRWPLRAVFRDSSFADSPAKINVGEIFKMLAPDTRVKVL